MSTLPVKPETSRPNTRKRKRGEPKPVLPIPPNKQPIHTPWINSLPATEYESKEQRLHDEIVAHASYILPTSAERLARQALYDQIASVLVWGKWRNAKLHLYGSVSTDLCLPTSDMDLVFEIHQIADTQAACKSVLYEAKRYLFEQQYLAEEIFVVGHARVPVLNMVSHPQTGRFNVDITVNGADGVPTIALVKEYLKTMPALRPLVLLIKALLERHGLHSAQSSGLSSYCVICMVISFLQINPMKRPQKWIDDPVASESLGWLLLDFLEYYGVEPRVPERPPRELPPVSQDIIDLTSTLTPPPSEHLPIPKCDGTPVNEPEAAEEGEVPKGEHDTESEAVEADAEEETFDPSNGFPYMTHYISVREGTLLSKKKKGWLKENAWENGRLCIECLVNPDNDIARSAGKIKAVRHLFRQAKARLERATLEGTGHNILGTIIGVTQETLDFRENIRTLVEQGRIRPFAEAQAPSASYGSYNDSRNRLSGHSQYNNAQRTGGGGPKYNGGSWSGGGSAWSSFSGGRNTSSYSRGEGSRGHEGVYKRQRR